MQQLDAVTLNALAHELSALLDNAKVSKVQHPSPHDFLIAFWGGSARPENRNLFYIHVNPEAPFCALTDNRQRQETVMHAFDKPTALCMLLRKHLNGANVVDVTTLPAERVLNLVFENFNELGNRVRLVLSLELMGKHSNMMLYDEVQGTILAVAHGVSERMSSHRELAAGLPYAPPPPPFGKQRLSQMTLAEFERLWLQKPPEEPGELYLNLHLAGFGRRMLADVLAIANEPTEIYRQLQDLEEGKALHPAVRRDGQFFTLVPPMDPTAWQPLESVNELMKAYFIAHIRQSRLRRQQQQLLHALEQQEKKRQRREKELIPMTDAEIDALQSTGDRLLAAFSAREVPAQPPAHDGQVTLSRYDTGEPWTIDIDPSLGWVENAQIYYRRAKKAKARKEAFQQMATQLQQEKSHLDSLKQFVSQADSLAELEALRAELAEAGFIKDKAQSAGASRKNSAETAGVITLHASSGLEILVGKSGRGNDAIVGKLSRPEDWWLHVHQMPGSHVLVRTGKEALDNQTLLEAANLAVWYSSARDSLNVPVVYTQAKYVRKIPQSYPGHVNYRQEQTVFITPDAGLLGRLLEQPV